MGSKARGLADLGNVYNDGALSNRNLIINGGFDVWQRGTSHTGAVYTSDRWKVSTNEPTTAMTKTANRDERNTFRVTFGTTVSFTLDQRIEGFGNVGYNQPVTLSFWVRGSRATTGTDFCRIRNHTTGTTLETLYYDITTSWVKVVKTFSADATWSKDDVARLYVFTASTLSPWAASDWVELSDVQLEVGDTATPFEHRSYGDELSRCQRYYQQRDQNGSALGAGIWYQTTLVLATYKFDATMRTAPSVSVSSDISITAYGRGANKQSTDTSIMDNIQTNSARLNLVMDDAGVQGDGTHIQISTGDIFLDAEL